MEKRFYSIKEVSELLSVPMPTLRYWEKEVPQLRPHVEGSTRRFYTPEDVQLVKRIQYLRSQNVPVSELSTRLRLDARVLDKKAEARETLLAIREELNLILKQL